MHAGGHVGEDVAAAKHAGLQGEAPGTAPSRWTISLICRWGIASSRLLSAEGAAASSRICGQRLSH